LRSEELAVKHVAKSQGARRHSRRDAVGALALAVALGALDLLAHRSPLHAQEGATPPHWIWYPADGQPGRETRYFRKEFLVKEPSRLALDVTADNRYVLFLDGEEIARGENWGVAQSVTRAIPTGPHVLAAEATNDDPGPAGFLLRGGVLPLGQGVPIHSNDSWQAAKDAPEGDAWKKPGFDARGWVRARDLGELGSGPWGNIAFESGDASGRFKVPEGFAIRQVAPASVTGSAVSFTFDHNGIPCVGVEQGPIVRLIDADRDGRYDDRVVITPQMKNCQGLYFDVPPDGGPVTLWAVGQGPTGTGIHRLGDEDGDGVFEKVLHHVPTDGMSEHGPHAITRGPDGLLYYNNGNHAHLKVPVDPDSPVDDAFRYEGELLPHYNDARGHAAGIMAPGGEIYRSDDDGQTWSRVVAGFRNEYDFAFNRDGEIFTFDSDMEWDIGLPWYRPVRVCFCPPGAEFGWRNGSGKWPSYYFDSLPSIVDVGRGSPTGVTFYQGQSFPEKYDDAFLYCDWSQGRILASKVVREGAGYRADAWELVTGQPLNCTDIEVGPWGGVYFTTGGRGTLGGLFEVDVLPEKPLGRPEPSAIEKVLTTPSPLSSFGRKAIADAKAKMGIEWALALEETVRDGDGPAALRVRALDVMTEYGPQPTDDLLIELAKDDDPNVRAKAVQLLGTRDSQLVRDAVAAALDDTDLFVRRRACEALVRIGDKIPVERLLPLLGSEDRWLRYAARVAVEHGGPADYRDQILDLEDDRALEAGLLALARTSKLDEAAQGELLRIEQRLFGAFEEADEAVDLLRLIGLTYLLGPRDGAEAQASAKFRSMLLSAFEAPSFGASGKEEPNRFHDGLRPLRWEAARLLAYLDEPKAIEAILRAQAMPDADHATQIHYAYCLRAIKTGWTPEQKTRLWAWYEGASRWDGGFSFLGYLDFMVQELIAVMDGEERARYLAEGARSPFPTRVLVRTLALDSQPERVADLTRLYASLDPANNPPATNELRALILEKLGQSELPEAKAALRRLAESDPDRRDLIARSLAARPSADDLPILLGALASRDGNTVNAAVNALKAIDAKPAGPEPLRALILMARRVGPRSTGNLNALASKWTGAPGPARGADFERTLQHWQDEYLRRFPDGPALAESAGVAEHRYTLDQLVSGVVRSGMIAKASPERGRRVLDRAKCLDCHKFGDQGAGLGPDLTTVSSRFRPEEVLESIVEPSKVISDQYKPVTVATAEGQVFNGMPAGGDDNTLVLLLSDGTKVNIPKADIDATKDSDVSVMPAGLADALSLAEVADLLALFESQPKVEVPADGKK
jgi:putative heme-binding domain-containing protein